MANALLVRTIQGQFDVPVSVYNAADNVYVRRVEFSDIVGTVRRKVNQFTLIHLRAFVVNRGLDWACLDVVHLLEELYAPILASILIHAFSELLPYSGEDQVHGLL